jgi:glycosyltransferase involved in cell wall biosynthesis
MRICIVSEIDVLTQALGSTEYLYGLAQLFVAAGHECHLLILSPLGAASIRRPVGSADRYAQVYKTIRLRRAKRFGRHFYSLDPQNWGRRLRNRIAPRAATQTRAWLDPVERTAASWSAARIRSLNPDLLIANYFNTADIFSLLPPKLPKAILVHDIISERRRSFENAGVTPDFAISEEREFSGFAQADLCIAIKEADAQAIRERAPAVRTIVIPPLVTVTSSSKPPTGSRVAVFVGGNFKANQVALDWFIGSVWRAVSDRFADAELRVIGRIADSLGDNVPRGVVKVGFVPDLAQEYQNAAVAIAPVRAGSGVNVKVIEALGVGVPVVATSSGAEGLPAWPEGVIQVANSEADFAEAVIRAFDWSQDADNRREVARYAAESFGFDRHRDRLNAEIRALVDPKAAVEFRPTFV